MHNEVTVFDREVTTMRLRLLAAGSILLLGLPLLARGASLSGFWDIGEGTVKITQTGNAVELDLGNGVVFKGSLKGKGLTLSYTLTAADTEKRIVEMEGAPEEERIAQKSLAGQVIKFTATVDGDSMSA